MIMPIKFLLLLLMFFSHLIADYNLQGTLADLKQRSWWNMKFSAKTTQEQYPYDYITALIEHSFMWSVCIMIPLLVSAFLSPYNPHLFVYISSAILTNTGIHALIDNEKANELSISLTTDQLLHALQIFATWLLFVLLY